MQLWKKNFLLVFVVFQSILFAVVLLFVCSGFYSELEDESNKFGKTVESSPSVIGSIVRNSNLVDFNKVVESVNEQRRFYYKVSSGANVIFSDLPDIDLDKYGKETRHLALIKQGSNYYFKYETSLVVDNNEVQVVYVADVSSTYTSFYQRIVAGILFGSIFSFLVNGIIYYQMKKIYRPVQNLSHELRTPLTLITGYSELLMRIKTTEEEKTNMSQAIFEESSHLLEVIEQLLLMGELKDGEVLREPLFISELILSLNEKYPLFKFDIQDEEKIPGNKVLLIRLLDNLLANAFNAGDSVQIKICKRKLTIINDGNAIPPKQLKKMNRGQKLSAFEYTGSGQGFIICREIVLLHSGIIKISSDEADTKVVIDFRNSFG